MQEVWKDIYFADKGITYDYRGLYQISNFGRVKSLIGWDIKKQEHKKREKLLTPIKDKDGYLKIILCKDTERKTFYVHRLVGLIFIPNPNNLPLINHKREFERDNNCVNNIEWCNHKYNMNYGTKQERESKIKTKYHVLQYDLQGNLIKKWFNLREIVLNTNYKKANIMQCCKNKSKTAYGYKWEYELIDSK